MIIKRIEYQDHVFQFAVGAPQDLLIAGCDWRQPLLLNEDWGGTTLVDNHRIAPTERPGRHGAAPGS